ncbi:putative peptide maturation dehydrogenase [Stenotrophomonas humi]
MRFRRCHSMVVLPFEEATLSLDSLASGGACVEFHKSIRVYAAHIDKVCTLEARACMLLLNCSAEDWQPLPADGQASADVMTLIKSGLLLLEGDVSSPPACSDQRIRTAHWSPLAAIYHRHTRWEGVDSAVEMERRKMVTARDLVRQLGVPPAEAPARRPAAIALPRLDSDEAELQVRVTCRNFDQDRALPLHVLAAMLQDVVMAQAVVESEPGIRFLKKNVPSGGGLHPMEAYIIARDVEGLSPAVYHYHAVAHELTLAPAQPEEMESFPLRLCAGQDWFAGAHVLVVLACRFERNFWKYRRHAKAYRAVTLDAGHISQAFYAAATRRGLGAFVTAAINEVDAEEALGLDPMQEGVIAVCGFGWRAPLMTMAELDPAGHVWKLGQAI